MVLLPAPFLLALLAVGALASAETYLVRVGAQVTFNPGYVSQAFYPPLLDVHVNDSVVFTQNTLEIHTVTFMGNLTEEIPFLVLVPGSNTTMMVNPMALYPTIPDNGVYTGTEFANSGLMGFDEGMWRNFTLKFTTQGTYKYLCLVHGTIMTGYISVKDPKTKIPSPTHVDNQVWKAITKAKSKLRRWAKRLQHNLDTPNETTPDGNHTITIYVGYSKQPHYDFMTFFPNTVHAKVGDVLKFVLPDANMAPHTITFYVNTTEYPLFIQEWGWGSLLPNLVLNPDAVAPHRPGEPLQASNPGVYSSGLLSPSDAPQNRTWSITMGEPGVYKFECILHDALGMSGEVEVTW